MKVSKIEVDELVDAAGVPLLDLKQVGKVWTDKNDGKGSGLDSDSLQGVLGSKVLTDGNIMSHSTFNANRATRKAMYGGSGQASVKPDMSFRKFIANDAWGTTNLFHTKAYPTNRPLTNSLALPLHAYTFTDRQTNAYFNIDGIRHKFDGVTGKLTNTLGSHTYPISGGIPFDTPKLPTVEVNPSNLSKAYSKGDQVYLDGPTKEIIANGNFVNNTAGWTSAEGGSTLSAVGGKLNCAVTTLIGDWDGVTIVVGNVMYLETVLSFDKTMVNASAFMVRVYSGSAFNDYHYATDGHVELLLTQTAITKIQFFALPSVDRACEFTLSNVSLTQEGKGMVVATKDVPINADINDGNTYFEGITSFSRRDFVFMESWREGVDKTGMVFLNGSVQHWGGHIPTVGGAKEGTFAGSDTYSRFGDWEGVNGRRGHGYIWKALTKAQQLKLASDPDNNIYAHDGVIYQARFRIRVVNGISNTWNNITRNTLTGGTGGVSTIGDRNYVRQQGNRTQTDDIGVHDSSILLVGRSSACDVGAYGDHITQSIPLMLVSRRNPGIYHPSYNSEGCATTLDNGVSKLWYETKLIKSTADCLDPALIAVVGIANTPAATTNLAAFTAGTVTKTTHAVTGTIASFISGRDDGLYVDEISDTDVEDNRMDSTKVDDCERYLEEEFMRYVSDKNAPTESVRHFGKLGFSVVKNGPMVRQVGVNNGALTADRYHFASNKLHTNTPYGNASLVSAFRNRGVKSHSSSVIIRGDNGNSMLAPQIMHNRHANGNTYISINAYDKVADNLLNTLFPDGTVLSFYGAKYGDVRTTYTTTSNDIVGDPRNFISRAKHIQDQSTVVRLVDTITGDIVISRTGSAYIAIVDVLNMDLNAFTFTDGVSWSLLGGSADGGYPAEWFDNGVVGIPNLNTSDNTSSLLRPRRNSGSLGGYTVQLNASALINNTAIRKVLITVDGITTEIPYRRSWLDLFTNGTHVGYYIGVNHTMYFNITGNGAYDPVLEAKAIIRIIYDSRSNGTVIGRVSGAVKAVNSAIMCQYYHRNYGGSLVNDMLDKRPSYTATHVSGGINNRFITTPPTTYSAGHMVVSPWRSPMTHEPLTSVNSNSPKVKILPILKVLNNVSYMELVYKEVKTDTASVNESGTSTGTVGDNGKFDYIAGTATAPDDNGNNVNYGSRHIRLTRFIRAI